MVFSTVLALMLLQTPTSDFSIDSPDPFETVVSVELAASKMPRPAERARIIAKRHALRFCIESEYQFHPVLSGEVTLEFLLTLSGDGRIESTKVERAEVDSPRFRTCLSKALERYVQFRPPGRRTELRVTFQLRPKP